MRYGVLADVHGNLPALEAAIGGLRPLGVDAWLCAGDLVGYGPFPNECVEMIASLGAICVAGNHDLVAVGKLSNETHIPLARQTMAFTRRVLSDDARAFLEALPERAEVDDGVVVAHGSLDDPETYVTQPEQARRQLARLEHGQRLLVLGHTHRARVFSEAGRLPLDIRLGNGRYLLNPGAVGQSRERRRRARCLLLDLDAARAAFLALDYDVGRVMNELRRQGLPPKAVHLRPSPVRRIRRVLGI